MIHCFSPEIQTAFSYNEEPEIVTQVENQLSTSIFINIGHVEEIAEENGAVILSSVLSQREKITHL